MQIDNINLPIQLYRLALARAEPGPSAQPIDYHNESFSRRAAVLKAG